MKNTLIILAIVLIAMFTLAPTVMHFMTMTQVNQLVIQDKERVVTGVGSAQESKYLIFTDAETFENTDSLLALKFNSSDVYGAIQIGTTCSFTVTGFRIPFFSMYRNILSADCV